MSLDDSCVPNGLGHHAALAGFFTLVLVFSGFTMQTNAAWGWAWKMIALL